MTKVIKTPRRRDAKGYVVGGSQNPTIAIRMPPELFAIIDGLARRNGTGFAAEARRMMLIGLGAFLMELSEHESKMEAAE